MEKGSIRMATIQDAEQLVAIYKPYVEHTAITFEYEVPSVEAFKMRIQNTLEKYPYIVATLQDEIIGYAYAGAFKTRAAYAWAVETSIYVKEDYRGLGVGQKLYDVLEGLLHAQHIINVNACITYPNDASIHFHKKRGYVQVAHFTKCGYKLNTWHDMIWMEKMLEDHPKEPQPIKTILQIDTSLFLPTSF